MSHLAKDFKFNPVQEGFTDKLAIFDPPKQETSIVQHERTRFYSKTPVKEMGPATFFLSGMHGGYLDTSSCTMTVTLSIKKPGGLVKVKNAEDKVALANLPLYSIFSQVQLIMNGTEVNPGVGSLFPYKNYMETLMEMTTEEKESKGLLRGYIEDNVGVVHVADPDPSSGPSNAGLTSRWRWTKDGQSVTFTGPLGLDEFDQIDRYLLNGVNLQLTFYHSRDNFRLMARDESNAYELKLEDMYISATMVRVRPEVLLEHSRLLSEKQDGLYAYPRTIMRQHIIPANVSNHTVCDVLEDRVPCQLVVGMVSGESFNGSFTANPFYFQHFNVETIGFSVSGTTTLDRPMQMDFSSTNVTEPYAAFLSGVPHGHSSITPEKYAKGNSLFCFSMEPHLCMVDGVYPVLKKGATRLELKFKSALDHPVVVVLMMKTPGYYKVSESRLVSVDY